MASISKSTWATVVLCFVASATIGCGDSDDGRDGRGSTAGGVPSLAATRNGSDEAQIRATLAYAGHAAALGDGEAFCAKLSPAGRNQYVASMTAWGRKGTCSEILAQTTALARKVGRDVPAVTVASVTVKGDRATTRSTGGLAGRSGDTLRLVRQDGEWKFSDLGLGKLVPKSQDH